MDGDGSGLPPGVWLAGHPFGAFLATESGGVRPLDGQSGGWLNAPAGEDSAARSDHPANMSDMEVAHSAPRERWRWQPITQPVFEKRTYAHWGYLLAGLPLGVLWFSLLVPLYVTGTVLIVIWIGLGWLSATQVLSRWIGLFERWLAKTMLGASIQAPGPIGGATVYQRGRAHLTDEFGYRMALWSLLRLITGTAGFVLAIVALVVPISLMLAPVSYVWASPPITWGWTLWVAPIIGIAAFFGAPHLIRGLGHASAKLAEWILSPSNSDQAKDAARRADRAEEQLRIDQELHDSIGHVLTMNVVQAGAGAHVFDQDPEFAREALTNIERRGRDALDELDRIIALVREGDVSRQPLPGMSDLEHLIGETRDAGMAIEARIEVTPMPPEVGRAAYRIVREALTNVAKHAPGAETRVTVAAVGDRIEVEVVNSPPSLRPNDPTTGTGSGLSGIRQRVAILGGVSEIGPTPDGGFRIHASLPIEEPSAS
jgi:signal transduction histidine kinase